MIYYESAGGDFYVHIYSKNKTFLIRIYCLSDNSQTYCKYQNRNSAGMYLNENYESVIDKDYLFMRGEQKK
jgi:hypothetical protein